MNYLTIRILIVSSFFIASSTTLNGQFWQKDVRWIYEQDLFGPSQTEFTTRSLTKVRDTIVDGFDCVILKEELSNSSFQDFHILRYLGEYIHWYDELDETFKRIYDFTLEQGETVRLYCNFSDEFEEHIVDSTYQVTINGQERKAMMIRPINTPCGFSGEIIEGIGSVEYLLPRAGFVDPPPGGHLICYKEGTSIYPTGGCENLVSTQSPTGNSIEIYPNPTSGIINFSNTDFDEVQLISLNGEILMRADGKSSIDMSKLANGLYYIRIVTNKQIEQLAKVVKTGSI